MTLLANGFRQSSIGKLFGITAIDGATPSVIAGRWLTTGRRRNLYADEAGISDTASLPDGGRHPVVWMMPQKAGGLSSRNSIIGSGTIAGTMQSGYSISAGISGSGTITNAPIGLIISIAAALIGSGTISTASVQALASMVANLTGTGSLTAVAQGLATLNAALTGSGTVTANNSALMDIAANIVGYGELTPEGIRDTVWRAILANYPDSGTAGNALSLASSGGVDYDLLAQAILAAAALTPIASNVEQVNGTNIVGSGIPPTFDSEGNLTDPGDPWAAS